jgi:folate-dependent phosphoribosylglycinamide formyltransferase PurN
MKILILSGSHPRHQYISNKIAGFGFETFQIRMVREPLDVTPPIGISIEDKINFNRHFSDRSRAELKSFGHSNTISKHLKSRVIEIFAGELNSNSVTAHVTEFNPDACIIFGTKMIEKPLISALPKNTFNLHLGLSPWYRGAATLFWPFYLLEPQFAGITIHKITDKPDAGAIYHQDVPVLSRGQGIHDVAIEAVKVSVEPLNRLFHMLCTNSELEGILPSSTGRIWRNQDFRPEHLRLIYNEFNNEIVNRFLDGELGSNHPKLISIL